MTETVFCMQAHGERDSRSLCQVGACAPSCRVNADPKYTMVVVTAAVLASVKKLYMSIMKPKIDCPNRNMMRNSTTGPVNERHPKYRTAQALKLIIKLTVV